MKTKKWSGWPTPQAMHYKDLQKQAKGSDRPEGAKSYSDS